LVAPLLRAASLIQQGVRLDVYAHLRSLDGARTVARGVGLRSAELGREGRAMLGGIAGHQGTGTGTACPCRRAFGLARRCSILGHCAIMEPRGAVMQSSIE
jgi:hypothetical protein